MANGYFERGEIYAVRMDSGLGSEEGAFRPGVIISSDAGNRTSPCVIIAYLTSKTRVLPHCIETMATGRRSWVLCDQIACVDKTRLSRLMGSCGYGEMREIDEALEKVLDLGYDDTPALAEKDREIAEKDTEIADLKTEMAGVATEIAKRDEEIASLKMEIEMWQKCYGRCMDMLVDTKVNSDLNRRTVVEPKVGTAASLILDLTPDPPKQPEQPEEQEQVERLDINNCTATALKKIGFSLAMARKIVAARPFKSVEDLKRVNGLKATQYKIMEPKLCCSPVVGVNPPKVNFAKDDPDPGCEKVNVNAVTAGQLHELTGIALSTCYCIKKYQKDNGPYKTLDEIKNAKQVTPGTIDKRRHLLEV